MVIGICPAASSATGETPVDTGSRNASIMDGVTHVDVYREDGRWAGWPANHGIWSWDNEILVGFVVGEHKEGHFHTYDQNTARQMFARSLNGGETWSIEDAYERGITGAALCHVLGDKATEPEECPGGKHPARSFLPITVALHE